MIPSVPIWARAGSFAKAFEYLDRFSRTVDIVETASMRRPGGFAADGNSIALFDKYTEFHPGSVVYAVEIDAAAWPAAR